MRLETKWFTLTISTGALLMISHIISQLGK
jgi:hypothetical protein